MTLVWQLFWGGEAPPHLKKWWSDGPPCSSCATAPGLYVFHSTSSTCLRRKKERTKWTFLWQDYSTEQTLRQTSKVPNFAIHKWSPFVWVALSGLCFKFHTRVPIPYVQVVNFKIVPINYTECGSTPWLRTKLLFHFIIWSFTLPNLCMHIAVLRLS